MTLRKKRDVAQIQDYPIFAYYCASIGETLDVYRFDTDDNDFQTAVNKYNLCCSSRSKVLSSFIGIIILIFFIILWLIFLKLSPFTRLDNIFFRSCKDKNKIDDYLKPIFEDDLKLKLFTINSFAEHTAWDIEKRWTDEEKV